MNMGYIQKITQKGIKPRMNPSDEKRVIISNYVLLLATIVAFGRIFMFYFSGDHIYSLVSIAATSLFFFAYSMNTKGHYDFGKFLLIIVGNTATLYKELSAGGNGNQIALIIAGFMVCFLLFSLNDWKKLLIGLSIASLNFILSVFFSDLLTPVIQLDPEFYYLDKVFGAMSGVVITVMVTYYFVKKSSDAENKLINSNEVLQNLNNKISTQKEKIENLFAKSDKLLLNILPKPIADRLKEGETLIADQFEAASIIFIDIAEFTKLTSISTPQSIVKELNNIFVKIDKISIKHGIEKIKTIGDCYMAASGIPEPRSDHAAAIAKMAAEVLKVMKGYTTENGFEIKCRIGLDCGSVVAGVIGNQKFIYDLWGEPVNTASRMQSHGATGKIHVTHNFKKALERQKSFLDEKFVFEDRGEIEVKGMGLKSTFFMELNSESLLKQN